MAADYSANLPVEHNIELSCLQNLRPCPNMTTSLLTKNASQILSLISYSAVPNCYVTMYGANSASVQIKGRT